MVMVAGFLGDLREFQEGKSSGGLADRYGLAGGAVVM